MRAAHARAGFGGALFDAFGTPIGPSPWPTLELMIQARPVCHILMPLRDGFDLEADGVDLIYACSAGGPGFIPDGVMGHLIAAIDGGGALVLHADSDDAIHAAVERILSLSDSAA
ncbi:MAG: hypothetical protein ACRYHQ_19135 [Janthinobacterium lividum]